jgi:hypothetical protein
VQISAYFGATEFVSVGFGTIDCGCDVFGAAAFGSADFVTVVVFTAAVFGLSAGVCDRTVGM